MMKALSGMRRESSTGEHLRDRVTVSRGKNDSGRSILALIRDAFAGNEEGGSLVEMAIVLPIVLVIMTGIFSFSGALHQKLELAEAVSTGGRFLATDRGDTDPCATTATKLYAAAPDLTSSKITLSFNLNGTTYSGATCSGTTAMTSGGSAQITATYPCSLSVFGKGITACTISEQVSEVVQ